MKYLLLAPLALYALAGCEATAAGPTEGTYDRSANVWRTANGSFAEDPVSGEMIDVSKAVTREYSGETYYFANEDHAREFIDHPEMYRRPRIPDTSDYPVTQ